MLAVAGQTIFFFLPNFDFSKFHGQRLALQLVNYKMKSLNMKNDLI